MPRRRAALKKLSGFVAKVLTNLICFKNPALSGIPCMGEACPPVGQRCERAARLRGSGREAHLCRARCFSGVRRGHSAEPSVVRTIAGVGIAALARSRCRRQPWAVSSLLAASTIRR